MARGIRLVVADVTVYGCRVIGGDQVHVLEPVAQRSTQRLGTDRVAVHDDRETPSREVTRIVPARELEGLGLRGVFQGRAGRIGIAAVGTDESIDHQLEHARRLVPVHRRYDHHAMRGGPARIDLVHPIVHLPERMVRVARAGPVTERHGGRDAGLAGQDLASVLRGEDAEVEEVALESRVALDFTLRDPGEAVRLRDFAGTGLVASSGAVDEEDSAGSLPALLAPLRCTHGLARFEPLDRQLVAWNLESHAGP